MLIQSPIYTPDLLCNPSSVSCRDTLCEHGHFCVSIRPKFYRGLVNGVWLMVRIQLKDISSLSDSTEEWREQNEGEAQGGMLRVRLG